MNEKHSPAQRTKEVMVMKNKFYPTARQANVLYYIYSNPATSLKEVADRFGITLKGADDHIRALIRKEYMLPPKGRRRFYVLTNEAKQFVKTLAVIEGDVKVYERALFEH